jgi:hypothetical protein
LGTLGFATAIAHDLFAGTGAESAVRSAALALLALAAAGWTAGCLAEWIVAESVRAQVAAELAAQEAPARQRGA